MLIFFTSEIVGRNRTSPTVVDVGRSARHTGHVAWSRRQLCVVRDLWQSPGSLLPQAHPADRFRIRAAWPCTEHFQQAIGLES